MKRKTYIRDSCGWALLDALRLSPYLIHFDELGPSFREVGDGPERLDAQKLHTETQNNVAQALPDLVCTMNAAYTRRDK